MLRKKIKKSLVIFFIVPMLLSTAACTSLNGWVGTKLGFDTDLTLVLRVDADINPDDKRRPSPLYIRLYELKATKMLRNSDFLGLYERDKEVLGADFVAKQELKRILPGKNRMDSFVLHKETRYIALYAEFLDYKSAKYIVIAPVVANNVVSTTVTILISKNNILLIDQITDIDDGE